MMSLSEAGREGESSSTIGLGTMVVCEHRHEEMPGTERLLSDAERGRFERVVVVALDV
jgi:hypothetical protein